MFELKKKTFKLSNKLTFFSLHTGCLYYIWKLFNINTAVVLCALHEPNYNLKAINVAFVI